MTARLRNLFMTTSALLALGTVPGAAGPDGPAVVGGSATVSGAGTSSVIVNQSSSHAVINWTTFNLGAGESARFNQPNSNSVVLNRVTGGLGASTIDGTLSANGRVYIVNRDGILFGKNAIINTASFLATTSDIRNEDFMAGRMNFNIPGRADASIVNLGHITAQTGGFAALVAPGVRNSGTITANLGTVALASGNMFTLDMYGDRLIQLAISDAIAAQVIDVETGKPLKSLVTNDGKLKAHGGRVELTAVQARAVVDSVINTKGVIEANSVGMRNGKIVLGGATASTKSAGAPRQVVKVSGKISAAGRKKGSTGGTVLITGEDIQFANALIDASGRAGGGKVLVGGDWGGGNPDKRLVSNASAALESYAIDHASTVTMDAASRITASARDGGNGGKVILWSDVATTFAGVIEAKGGPASGDGGFVETSSQGALKFAGSVDARAPFGTAGVLLLDPENYYINTAGTPGVGDPTASAISVGVLQGLLANQSVVISTLSTGSNNGDIFVQNSVSWTGNNSLTLNAHHNIQINDNVTISNTGGGSGNLILHADSQGAGNGGALVFQQFTFGSRINFTDSAGRVDVFYNPTSFPTPTDFTPAGQGDGTRGITVASASQLNAYMLVNNAGNFQDISRNLTGTYALSHDIDFTGFGPYTPVGDSSRPFIGILEGQGFAIRNFNLASDLKYLGLFGYIGTSGVVRNLNFADSHVGVSGSTLNQSIGLLAGQNDGSIVNVGTLGANNTVNGGTHTAISAGGLVGLNNGTIAGTVGNGTDVNVAVTIANGGDPNNGHPGEWNYAGGVAGINTGTVTDMRSAGNVTAGKFSFAGGLVGQNGNTGQSGGAKAALIQSSSASGNVAGSDTVGGLAGVNFVKSDGSTTATISNSHASGNVVLNAGGINAGGLVGQNIDRIETSFSSSTVTAAGSSSANASIGGLAGTSGTSVSGHNAIITASYSTGTLSGGTNTAVGGLVGVNSGQIIDSYSTSAVSGMGSGNSAVGGLVGVNGGTGFLTSGDISNSYATGNVSASNGAAAGGFVGYNSDSAFISNSYATGAVTLSVADAFTGQIGGGFVGDNEGTISNSYATGLVSSSGGFASLGGFAGTNDPGAVITGSYATGNVSASSGTLAFAGGFVGANGGFISQSNATGNVSIDALVAMAGGFVGLNLYQGITLSYATGNVIGGDFAFLGGFAGLNAANINQAYSRGSVSGGATSIVGGFVGVNIGVPGFFPGGITQAYALGPTTGGPGSFVGGFSGFNFGSLDQAYAAGPVTGGAGSTTGGLVAANPGSFTLPDLPGQGGPSPTVSSGGTATNSYWDRQTTGQETSAGGTAMDTQQLAGGALPPGFDSSVWTHGSYPQLVNLGRQDTTPGPALVGPSNGVPSSDAPSIVVNQLAGDLFLRILATVDPLIVPPPPAPPPPAPAAGQTQTQQQQQTTGQIGPNGPNGPIPGQLDAGPGRFFFVPPPGETRFVSNQVMVQVRPDITIDQLRAVVSELGGTIIASQSIGLLGTTSYQIQLPEGRTVADVVHVLVDRQIINGAQPIYNFRLVQETAPAAPQGPIPAGQEPDLSGQSRREGDAAQYVLDKLHLQQVHQTIKGTNIKIAVIDSEIDASHPDIKDNIAARYDATGAEEKPHAHGTGMAGAIVAHTRLMGIAPGAQIAAVHAFGSGTSAESTTINILKGLDWALNNGARIVNMSFAGPRDPSLERAIKVAHDKGIVLIAAAGNGGPRSAPLYPGADANVIAVTATDSDDKLFGGANRGRYISIAAPGVDILVPAPDRGYQMTTGTSVATAHISGVVALLLERNPQLKPDEVRRILQASARRLGPNNEFGAGLVDPVKALELAAPRSASAAPARR